MMLYHPDRQGFHINEINRLADDGNFDGLLEYSHIIKLERIEEIANSLDSYEDIDYSPVYAWDIQSAGFRIVTDSDEAADELTDKRQQRKLFSFYNAVKIRAYGHTNIEYPTYYLEDLEEFELSGSDINDLDGIQFCIHTKVFDLSDNYISDLSPLENLTNIEDLNLADNEIGYIDSLSYLVNLRSITLCNNQINDITPLFALEKLEYADVSGNNIPQPQLDFLIGSGITVIF